MSDKDNPRLSLLEKVATLIGKQWKDWSRAEKKTFDKNLRDALDLHLSLDALSDDEDDKK